VCQYRNKDNRQTQSEFECVVCRHKNHADVIGAINVLERGHRLLACGENDIGLLDEAGTGQLSDELEPKNSTGITFL